MSEIDQKMADIVARIAKEQKIIDASKAIRLATRNSDVLRKTDAEEREARKSLEYFHATLADLRTKRDQLAATGPGGYNDYDRPLPLPPNDQMPKGRQYSNLGAFLLSMTLLSHITKEIGLPPGRFDQSRYSPHTCKNPKDVESTRVQTSGRASVSEGL